MRALLIAGYDVASSQEALRLATPPDVAAVGVHPHDASGFDSRAEAQLRSWLANPAVAAVGETGLDFHYPNSARKTQEEVFAVHVALAAQSGLPLVIHCRDAYPEVRARLAAQPNPACGVVHSFDGEQDDARELLDLGYFLGVGGIATYPKSERLRSVLRWAGPQRLLLETDSPYLPPQPVRGRRCEPEHALLTARLLAPLLDLSLEELDAITTANAARCFPRWAAHLASPSQTRVC